MLRRALKITHNFSVALVRPASYSFSPVQRMREENEELKRKRLFWQSRKRGITENDLLLGTFADQYLKDFTMEQMLAYDRIINSTVYDPTVTEWDLYYWFVEERPYPEDLIKDVELTAEYAQEKIDGVREMMEMIIEHSKNKKRDIIVQPKFNKAFV
ncbi:unnamed protein product [Oikopleura dioica]|uniref:Succinate dehydrogenase assembly factor 2, mitochondrial n=1 Tax=Oikopleura dioica TaxID=34765 RepID=E4XBM5_OIKDI|nr:unnamed protein product [Oikopleura dioica]